MLKLYYSPGACAMASHIALEEAGADYELQKVDLKKGEQRTPEYLAVNPAGSTPAMATEQGVITQNVAILAYVAQTHPQAKLAPLGDAYAFARMQAFNAWLASSLHPAIGKVLFSRLEGAARDEALELALAKYDLAEQHLLVGPWALGADHSVTDGYLMVFTRWARQADLLDKARFPGLNAHLDRVQSRPAVQRALAAEGLSAL
ncbi:MULTISPECIES: glutathione S-transferase family protein [unclassified Brevundimonas]|uniref:glutathione S-transferase family protein n=1 Tax=unclassified Brevundimonas TaxID=2622653 RepID=UPI000CFC371D|nr:MULTISPECIES: glutathione S-transferase N-terminal domain-containing protein [unclassified Brevundimonas]PRA30934.1 glutathione S-transferase [Brevundimonas sp. MYb27]PQZ82807.1 glutathione S-transferase [Brevundimonas sp. MYb31]PRB16798.1 glutathione S-transferase [Brevundimonas sp. MYb52]PRB34666.1 glutathione S-transferase [Brevundimonas sp. MYb46]PRB54768.1 glutathione S-transferase [Brevundimonas sp. MYb33]